MHTPPTAYDSMITRSGRPLGEPMTSNYHEEREMMSNSPKQKKRTRKQKAKTAGPELPAALSILTKDYEVPLKNMEAWVTRSAEVRDKEAAKAGRVPRPMNSFMLYRSAFAERVKKFCDENNHQVVSQVTGQSWPMEPKEVRDFYDHLALTEKENHLKAHPDYKFTPNKNANNKKRRWGESENESEIDDPDWRSSRGGTPKRHRSAQPSRRSTPYESRPVAHPMATYQQPSPWDSGNAGNPMGEYMPQANPYDYPPTSVPYFIPDVEDVNMRKTILPAYGSRTGTPLVGMPGGDHHELLALHSQMSTPNAGDGNMDPSFFQGTATYAPAEQSYAPTSNYQYSSGNGTQGTGYHYSSAPAPAYTHPGQQTFTDSQASWGGEYDQGADANIVNFGL